MGAAKEVLFVGDDDALREVLAESLREAVSVSAVRDAWPEDARFDPVGSRHVRW